MRRSFIASVAAFATAFSPIVASAETVMKAVMESDVKILDPIWSGAYITRNYGYMVYDTLFSIDEKFEVKPQMVDTWKTSDNGLVWTFTLRDGLEWHDGKPVTAEDCVASLKRWSAKDSMGLKLASFLSEYKIVDAKTFQIVLKVKFGPMLQALGKPSVVVPFMMPARIAATDPNTQISEYIVFLKNTKYKPRAEPASGLAGGKVVSLDRVEWVWIPDSQTQVNALINGEIDMLESVAYDHLPVLEKAKGVKVLTNKTSNQYGFRLNWLQPPFNNVKVRQAVAYALSQDDFLQASVGDKR